MTTQLSNWDEKLWAVLEPLIDRLGLAELFAQSTQANKLMTLGFVRQRLTRDHHLDDYTGQDWEDALAEREGIKVLRHKIFPDEVRAAVKALPEGREREIEDEVAEELSPGEREEDVRFLMPYRWDMEAMPADTTDERLVRLAHCAKLLDGQEIGFSLSRLPSIVTILKAYAGCPDKTFDATTPGGGAQFSTQPLPEPPGPA